MSHITLTDAQIHARATAHALEHHVSYFEALYSVVSFAELQADAAVAANAGAAMSGPMTDAAMDAAARRYAAEHGVSYVDALQNVAQSLPDATRASQAGNEDDRIHAAAQAHARSKGVSYSEGLEFVTMRPQAASFSEGAAPAADVSAVQSLQSQPIEIFRAGTHVDNAGTSRVFSVADVKAMAAAYSPTHQEAPLTLGHPDTNHPAYGWVKALTATDDGRLLMQADKVDPDFAAGVKAGRHKKRSASFYPPQSPSNPTPGQWYLRHVGWLGAHPPAVKGLADVSFGAETADEAVCFGWM